MTYKKSLYTSLYLVFIFLAGCAGITSTTEQPLSGIDGIACVGKIDNPPEGLVEATDTRLLNGTLKASGDGELCAGKVFITTQPVTVYRVWNSKKDYTRYGKWWSFQFPKGPRQQYRRDNVICPSWSALDRMTTCTIKPGTKIVVGPGQSAKCKNTTYEKSAVNQVFIPNDSRKKVILVEKCTAGIDWP